MWSRGGTGVTWFVRGRSTTSRTARGLTTAQVDWVAIWNAPTVTWEFRERPDPQGAIAREMIGAGLVSQEAVENFAAKNIVFRDHVWTAAAAHIIRRHRPHLMMFHLLTLDSMQHRYGPGTLAATAAMAHLDAQVATIVQAVEQAGLAARTTFVIVSDHGFKTVPASDHAERRLSEGRVARGDRRQGRRARRCT